MEIKITELPPSTEITYWHLPTNKDEAIRFLVREVNKLTKKAGGFDYYIMPLRRQDANRLRNN